MLKKVNVSVVLFMVVMLSACTSTQALKEQAQRSNKAGDYYASIGQEDTAKEQYKHAKEHQERATSSTSIFVDLIKALLE